MFRKMKKRSLPRAVVLMFVFTMFITFVACSENTGSRFYGMWEVDQADVDTWRGIFSRESVRVFVEFAPKMIASHEFSYETGNSQLHSTEAGWISRDNRLYLVISDGKEGIPVALVDDKTMWLEDRRGKMVLKRSSQADLMAAREQAAEIVAGFAAILEAALELEPLKGGTFTMGCTPDQGNDCDSHEKPTHQVTLSDFYIGKYEVTQAQWKTVMGKDNNPSNFKGDNLPVENVNWNEVQEFIRILNKVTGKDYRLPTEAEWEYAARGGNKSNGYKYSGSDDIEEVAWFMENSGGVKRPMAIKESSEPDIQNISREIDVWDFENAGTRPVGTKKANELGIHDMSGNVWEWINDWFGNYSSNPQKDPQGPSSGYYCVIRGGSLSSRAEYASVSNRYSGDPGSGLDIIGFRLARGSR